MISAVVFDFGGVLVKDIYTPYVDEHLKSLSIGEQKEFVQWEQLAVTGKLTKEDFTAHFNSAFGQGEFEALDKQIRKTIKDRENRSVLQLLPVIKEKYILALLSNNMAWWTEVAKTRDFISLFAPAIFSNEVGLMKPFTPIYELLLQKLSLPASEVLFIDNALGNIEAAKQLKIKTIHYHWGEDLKNELDQVLELDNWVEDFALKHGKALKEPASR